VIFEVGKLPAILERHQARGRPLARS